MLNSDALFFVDCQSTGTSPSSSSLLEIAWNDVSIVVKQLAPVPQRITRLTGIAPEEIEEGQTLNLVWQQMSQDIEDAQQRLGYRPFAVAHFARFEKTYLDQMWVACTGEPFPLKIFCTHRIAKILFPKLPNYGLRALAGWFGTPLKEGKRAAHHVQATRQIWAALSEELANKNIFAATDLESFCEQRPTRPQSARREFLISKERRLALPESPGIYRYIDRSGRVLYVGKATSLRQRVNSYFTGGCRGDHRKLEMLAQAIDVNVEILSTPLAAGLREYDEIRRLKPPYNVSFKGPYHDPQVYLRLFEGAFIDRGYEADQKSLGEVFYGLQDFELLRNGIRLWRNLRAIPTHHELTHRELLNMGVPLLRQWIQEETARLKSNLDIDKVEQPNEFDTEDDKEIDLQKITWTIELVANGCDRILRRATRHYIKQKWLRRIAKATIKFIPAPSKQSIIDVNCQTFLLEPGMQDDAFDPRRVKVLLHELRRLEAKGGSWNVIKPWAMTVPFWI